MSQFYLVSGVEFQVMRQTKLSLLASFHEFVCLLHIVYNYGSAQELTTQLQFAFSWFNEKNPIHQCAM